MSAILRNPRLPAVNQNSLGAGGRRVRDDGNTEVFAKPLSDGSVTVGLFNRGGGTATISATAAQLGLSGSSLWAGGEIRVFDSMCLDVDSQGTANGTRLILWTCNSQANQRWTRA
ncbi:ricin-type beta-trefoil lectin domain protein [Actinosynnema sp. NPDC091369]